eukprot:scaffold667_cov304-Chaetoceros_neogracile.AAC.12
MKELLHLTIFRQQPSNIAHCAACLLLRMTRASLLLLLFLGNAYLHCINALSFQSAKTASKTSHDDLLQNRRKILKSTATLAAMLSITTIATTSDKALAAQTAGEAVRRSAANLPGYGQPDIYYPSSFIGKWKATRTIISSDDPALLSFLPLTISYDLRFITVDGDSNGSSNSNGKVIADRAFNEASYYNAIRALLEIQQPQLQLQSQLQIPASIQSVNWSPFNPNVLSTIYNNGSSKEIKVTKRASELDDNSTTTLISSSEYRRVTATTGGMGIPSVSASRVMTKWKGEGEGGNQIVEGIEIVYLDGTMGGDPLVAGSGAGAGGGKPQLSSKARLRLERFE